MATFNRYHSNPSDTNIPFNYEVDSPWLFVPSQAGDSQNLAYGSFDLCDIDQQPNFYPNSGIRYQNFSAPMPTSDLINDNSVYFSSASNAMAVRSPHVMLQAPLSDDLLTNVPTHPGPWLPHTSQSMTAAAKCIKCLVQQKACEPHVNGGCTRCSRSAPTEKAWKFCGCIDATITLYRLFDSACLHEINSILTFAGFSSLDADMSNLHQYFPAIYKEFAKPQGLLPLSMSTNHGRAFKIPFHDGDKAVLFKASIDYLKETQDNISTARHFLNKAMVSRTASIEMGAVHDFLAIAQERRRAGHDMLRSLSDLVKSVFKGQSRSAPGNRYSQLVKTQKRVLEGLECLCFILLHGTTSSDAGYLGTAKHLALVLERLVVILSEKIRKEVKSNGAISNEGDIHARNLLAQINNL